MTELRSKQVAEEKASVSSKAQFFAAIARMQSQLSMASKSKTGHGYNYADLAGCIKTAQEPLSANGLAVVQLLKDSANGGTALCTTLVHESGEMISSTFTMAQAVLQGGGGKNPAQVMGSQITYMRRYAYCAIIGLASDDDDAAMVGQQYQNYNNQGGYRR